MVKFDWSKFAKVGDSYMIRIPMRLVKDKSFPFKDSDYLIVKIDNGKLVVEKE